jgi:hypothetical protein
MNNWQDILLGKFCDPIIFINNRVPQARVRKSGDYNVINLGNVHAQGLFLCTCREGIDFDRLFYDLASDR